MGRRALAASSVTICARLISVARIPPAPLLAVSCIALIRSFAEGYCCTPVRENEIGTVTRLVVLGLNFALRNPLTAALSRTGSPVLFNLRAEVTRPV